ncbi:MAG TPA: tripartite tricarboxylate transporter substrate binding protein [Burkholderiales bacterium]|jgi:tripartite-type tricarboxylate transporter receptor subunit TctC|nr:tripartite tricarboxylate transporter substrate binding protein [Burkholderiales bacterium]
MKKLFLLVLTCFSASLFAQEWSPSKTVRIIVPIQGGTVDILARLAAPRLQEVFGQPVIVENKPGAGGNIGADLVAKSDPDGHTILAGYTGPITVNVTLFSKLPYDPQKDLAPITLAVTTPQFLTVHPGVPFNSVKELVAYAKANPGKLSYGSVGTGSASHLTMEMFKAAAGINLVHVPYKGSAPNVADLLAGNVQLSFLVPGNVLPYIPQGKLKVLAASGRKRFPAMPDTPTMIEEGFADFEAIAWIGFLAPGGTPKPVIDRYNKELVKILHSPDVHKRLTDIQFEVVASSPEQFAEYIRWETPRWAKVIRDTGAKAGN